MNHAFLSRWSTVLQTWVAVPETARRRQCGGGRRAPRAAALTLALAVAPAMAGITLSGDVSPPGPPTLPDWSIPGTDLYIGKDSAGSMTVDSASKVSNGLYSYIGYNAGGIGSVTVTGAGSSWSTVSIMHVGSFGQGQLDILDGGTVTADYGDIGYETGGFGAARINGVGSLWRLNARLSVGSNNGNGKLTIENGGQAHSGDGWIGITQTGTVTVTGAGSTWKNDSILVVGNNGSGILNIQNGGAVSNTEGYIGMSAGGASSVTVSGVGSIWTNAGTLYVGQGGSGSLTVDSGGTVGSSTAYIGLDAPGGAIVTGPGSTWTNASKLFLGIRGTGTLDIEAGGKLSTTASHIGLDPGSTGIGTVTGAGSTWSNSDVLIVGESGNGTLDITAGGMATARSGSIGDQPSGTGAVRIDGAGSLLRIDELLAVGGINGSGTLSIENGGQASSSDGWIGVTRSGAATVTGANSAWTNTGALFVGLRGTGALNIEAGGAVSNASSTIGSDPGSTGTVTVTGAGSVWTNLDTLNVGSSGNATLDIEAGGVVKDPSGAIGVNLGGTGAVTVTGPGSTWIHTNDLTVGVSGNGSLTIENGGAVSNTTAYIGQSGNGAATVSGANSKWTNAGMLFVGVLGTGDLKIQAGGTVSSTNSVIGSSNISTGSATVTGAGSTWTNSGTLFVGESGNGTLDITAGGMVTALSGSIGYKNSGTGAARIDGAGSLWRLDGLLTVGGHDGSGTMIIENGGQASSGDGSIGVTRTGAAIITGAGSAWTNSGTLTVGVSGAGTLTLTDQGRVSVGGGAGTLYLGYNSLTPSSSGAGTLNIGAAPGNPAAAPGTVEAGQIQFGNGSFGAATLNFNHTAPASAPYDFNVPLAATGTGSRNLNQLAGVTRLTANSPSFNGLVTVNDGTLIVAPGVTLGTSASGGTVVNNGRLQVDGTLGDTTSPTGSPVVVIMSSTLAGAGTIVGNVDLPTVAPSPLPGTPLGTLEGRQGQTLTITGNLSFAYDSHINAILGSATAPSATTGLFNVGGNLTLDGILNVSTAGGFGPGIYRLINYAGTLTDNGLDIGAHPAGFDLSVQTGVANQVNLGVSPTTSPPGPGPGPDPGPGPTPTLIAWDGGNPTLHNNNNVDGGLGIWHVGGGNWTDLDGTINSPYPATATFVLFQARPGIVTIDNSAGLVRVTGLQFATSGYRLQGDPLTLQGDNNQTLIRVGDGTPASAATTATIAAPIAGNSNLTKTDYGTLILSGSNTYTGGTEIRSGTLSISADANLGAASGALGLSGGTLATTANLASARPLTFTQNSRLDIAAGTTLELRGSIGGGNASQFDKTSAGTLLLTGNGAGFGGAATVSAGTLRIGGGSRLGGSASVANGATLAGSGTIGSGAGSTVTLASGATLAPGNSIGTLTVDGDLSFEPGSRYEVEVDPHGSAADLTQITGHATLNGGAVAHIGNDGTYPLRASYTILSAQGGLSGRFDAVSSIYTFLTPSLSYDDAAGTVALTLDRNDTPIATPALTRNQAATALGVDSLGWNADNPVYDAIVTLTGGSPALAASLDALSGEIHASARAALVDDSRHVRDAMNERLRSAFNTVGAARAPVMVLGSGEPATAPAATPGLALWTQGFGGWGQTAGDGNAARLTRSGSGLFLGIDGPIGDNARIGALAGYSRTDLDVDARASSGNSENTHAGLYGGAQWNKLALRAGLAYTWHDIDTHRSANLPTFQDYLKGHYDGGTAQAFADLGYRIDTPTLALEPFARVDNVNLTTDSFNEHGGAAALEAKSERTATSFSTLGLRGETALTLANGTTLTPRATLGWRHAWGDIEPHSTFAFSGGTAFSIAGVPIARDAALLEAGVEIAATPTVAVSLAYTGQIARDTQDHALQARIQWRF